MPTTGNHDPENGGRSPETGLARIAPPVELVTAMVVGDVEPFGKDACFPEAPQVTYKRSDRSNFFLFLFGRDEKDKSTHVRLRRSVITDDFMHGWGLSICAHSAVPAV